tara:strand:- start:404 stop:1036 length:633 start_codon:yes stop_codon:yes gene_type:complete
MQEEVKHLNTQKDIDELRVMFDEFKVKPKLVTLGDALKNNWEAHPEDHLRYANHLLEHRDLEPVVHENWKEKMDIEEYNLNYHATKLIWLINEIKTNGLYSIPQAYMKDEKRWSVHPGTHRVHALIHLKKLDQQFVVWDRLSFPNETIDFDTWFELYSKSGRSLFAVLTPNMIEMHVQEDRPDMYANSEKVMKTVKEVELTIETVLDYPY